MSRGVGLRDEGPFALGDGGTAGGAQGEAQVGQEGEASSLSFGVGSPSELVRHPKVGASWEGFALAVVERRLAAPRRDSYFWATHGGAEVDLVVMRGRHRLGFEFKRTTAPEVTKSMRIALEDLRLQRIDVVHAGSRTFQLAPKVRALALARSF